MSAPGHYFDDEPVGAGSSSPPAVYFDHNATTPLEPRVRDAMIDWMRSGFGNPSSVHRFGQRARGLVEEARSRVAALLDAEPNEILFAASGTEANNAVLASAGRAADGRGHLVVSAIEHPSIVQAARRLESGGFEVTTVDPDSGGLVRPDDISAVLRPETRLVAVMLANNELGTLQPVAEIAEACRERQVPFLCDAVQAIGKVPVSVRDLGVDYLTVAAHKFHGPLGAAALWVRPGTALDPLLVGGGQERRRRASTENLTALLGFGVASEIATLELPRRHDRLAALRDRFERGLGAIEGAAVRCRDSPRLPNTSCVTVDGVDAGTLLMRLDLAGYAVSTGAACASGTVEPSRTLLALGLSEREALSTLRVSFGLTNTADEIDAFLPVLESSVAALRERVAVSGRRAG